MHCNYLCMRKSTCICILHHTISYITRRAYRVSSYFGLWAGWAAKCELGKRRDVRSSSIRVYVSVCVCACAYARARVCSPTSDPGKTHRTFSHSQHQQGRNTSSEHYSSPAHCPIQTSSSLLNCTVPSAQCPGALDCSSFPNLATPDLPVSESIKAVKESCCGLYTRWHDPSPNACGFSFACEGILPACTRPRTRTRPRPRLRPC